MSVAPIPSASVPPTEPLVSGLAHTSALKLKGAALRNASPAEQRTAVAAQFEAILVRQLLGKTMSSMLGGDDSGVAGSVYGDLVADTFAQQLTSGPGLGLGRMLVQQLTPKAGLPDNGTTGQQDQNAARADAVVPSSRGPVVASSRSPVVRS